MIRKKQKYLSFLLIFFITCLITSSFFIFKKNSFTLAKSTSNFVIDIQSAPQCFDGLDNDGDGKIDYPNDPGCSSPNDDDETDSSPGGGGGGGGGGGYSSGGLYIIPQTSINFSGYAYPLSQVVLLKDGLKAASTVAGPDAKFNISLTNLTPGNYTFSIYGLDKDKRRSSLFNFNIYLSKGASTSISGIFIAPTIDVNKTVVKRGEDITIFGQSCPYSEITLVVSSEKKIFRKTKSDKEGIYLYNLETTYLEEGKHYTKAKARLENTVSPYSPLITFNVGKSNLSGQRKIIGDLNNDNRVDLVDFSILIYWYEKPNPPSYLDLNNDNIVNLVDFSIMVYYWTG